MASPTVRIGFIGVGNMGQCAHLQNYVSIEGCEVVALAEVRGELGKLVATRYGVPKVYASHKELLTHEQLDGLIAAQPYSIHGQLLPELYASGVPLLTEKPLGRSVQVGEQLIHEKPAGQRHYLGYHKRSDPASDYARTTVQGFRQSGELGALKYIRVSMPPGDWIAGGFNPLLSTDEGYPPLERDPAADDMDKETYAVYDSFVNYYIHQVNLIRYLLGEDYTVDYVDPDGVMMAFTSQSGVVGVLEMQTHQTSLDWQEEALVTFERGYLRLKLPAPLAHNRPGAVELFTDNGDGPPQTVCPQLPWCHAMRQQAINFVAAIRGESTPLSEAAEGLADLKIARQYIRRRFNR